MSAELVQGEAVETPVVDEDARDRRRLNAIHLTVAVAVTVTPNHALRQRRGAVRWPKTRPSAECRRRKKLRGVTDRRRLRQTPGKLWKTN